VRSLAILFSSAVIGAALVSGCGGSAPTPAPESGVSLPSTTVAPVGDIVISHFAYAVRAPVKPGQQITVINDDEASHTLTADANDAFDVHVSGGGGVETFTAPVTSGTYPFHCKYHANMHGELTVQ
jgi:plastocyanin